MLGRHDGILRYTIGQRRGIGIASGEPLYVVHLDADRARVIVGPREALETHKIYLRASTGWATARSTTFRPTASSCSPRCARPARRGRPCCIIGGGATWVELGEGESGIAPGQACVLYADDGNEARVLGGGFIERSERGAEAEAMLYAACGQAARSPPNRPPSQAASGAMARLKSVESIRYAAPVRISAPSIASSPLVRGFARASRCTARKCSSSRVSGMPSSTGT